MTTDLLERTVLTRSLRDVHPQIRRADDDEDGSLGVLFGHAAMFNVWTEIDNWYEGHFLERISPKAFNKTIKENLAAIRCLYKHGWDPTIGDKVLGPIDTLRGDGTGLYYEVPLYDTSYNRDLAPGLRDGQYGASYRAEIINFTRVEKPAKSAHNPDALPEVTYTEFRLKEFGPCTFGAEPASTSTLRSELDDLWPRLRSDPDLLEQFLARAHDLRTPPPDGAAGDGTPDEKGAAATDVDEPARSHSDATHPDADRLWLARLLTTI
jgi:hypothetical protein